MTKVEEILTEIEQLSEEERTELTRRLYQWEDDEWDEQMKRDIDEGKWAHLLKEVDEEIDAGDLRDMP